MLLFSGTDSWKSPYAQPLNLVTSSSDLTKLVSPRGAERMKTSRGTIRLSVRMGVKLKQQLQPQAFPDASLEVDRDIGKRHLVGASGHPTQTTWSRRKNITGCVAWGIGNTYVHGYRWQIISTYYFQLLFAQCVILTQTSSCIHGGASLARKQK